MFLETLVDFIVLHREDLQDWLFVLLTQLLKKMGADLLGSVQAKVQKALDVTRSELHWKTEHSFIQHLDIFCTYLILCLFLSVSCVHMRPLSFVLQGFFSLRSAVQHLNALYR